MSCLALFVSVGIYNAEPLPAPQFGGGYFYRPRKTPKKKKKLRPVVELDHVIVVPQETPDLEDKRIYRYFGELAPTLRNIRVEMVESSKAMEMARVENKRMQQQKDDDSLLILLAIYDDD